MPMLDPNSKTPFPVGGPKVEPIFDNHLVHIMEHKKPTRNDVYKQLPEWKKLFWQDHVLSHLMAIPPPPGQAPQGGPPKQGQPKPATSKANERGDKTMDTVREGGNVTMGGGGSNQFQ
jgi:hypothetical protein